jgi:hypothetical protein
MKITQEIYASFLELSDYFIELVEYKFKRLETGETDTRTMDVLSWSPEPLHLLIETNHNRASRLCT